MAIAAPKKRPARPTHGPLATSRYLAADRRWVVTLTELGRQRLVEFLARCPDPWRLVAGDARMNGVHAMLKDGRLTRDEVMAEGYYAVVRAVRAAKSDGPIATEQVYGWVLKTVGDLANPPTKRDRFFRDTVRPDAIVGSPRDDNGWDTLVVKKNNGHEVKADSMAGKTLDLLKHLSPERRKAVEARHGLNGRPACDSYGALAAYLGTDRPNAYRLYAKGIAQLRRMMNADGA